MSTDQGETMAASHEATMEAEDVLFIYNSLRDSGVKIWVDGGWGIDALLGEQARSHADFDVAVDHSDVDKLREVLGERGYTERPRRDASPYNVLLSDRNGQVVDVHTFFFDEKGKNVYGIGVCPEFGCLLT